MLTVTLLVGVKTNIIPKKGIMNILKQLKGKQIKTTLCHLLSNNITELIHIYKNKKINKIKKKTRWFSNYQIRNNQINEKKWSTKKKGTSNYLKITFFHISLFFPF